MTVTVNHAKTNAISDWTQAQLDEQIALGNFAPGTTLANIVLPSDWNDDHTLTGLGTMAEQNANTVAITGGSVNGTTIGATTASTGAFTSVTTSGTATIADTSTVGQFGVKLAPNFAAGSSWDSKVSLFGNVNLATGAGSGAFGVAFDTTQGTSLMSIAPALAWYNTKYLANVHQFFGLGFEQLRVNPTNSAVNYVQVTGGATGNSPVISGQGSDSNVALSFTSKGTNAIRFLSNNAANLQFRIVGTNTAVNNLAVTGTIATNAPSLSSEGTDTNISMAFQPKGTGAIDLAAGSSGVNISNGGTVTAITRTGNGTGYTSFPTVNITAPTTAGGVQSVATVTNMQSIGASISAGGTGYTVGNVITITGGTPVTVAATFTVSAVSSGVVTAVTALNFAPYTVLPTAPVSTTGGSGTGLTLTALTWAIGSSFTISNAGSGYIEQPTITFSGGGGSGAAAYAIVGSGTIIRSLANTLDIHTPAGSGFQVNNASGSTLIYSKGVTGYGGFLASSITGNSAFYFGYVNNTEVGRISMTSSNNLSFGTSSSALEQLRVSHTASAVNYVQVTGSATANIPVISTTGSDASVGMELRLKGTPSGPGFRVTNNNGSNVCFAVTTSAATPANYMRADPAAASASPAMSAQGSDTNIDLTLTPKGTGLVRFGTYVAGALLATGYINIKAADGTTYKVLVST